jgi:RNA polymerase sigma-70 factor, ECF subfamily
MKTPDEKDYGRWIETYAAGMFRLAFRLCGQRELAEDLVQDTFCEAWKSRGKLASSDKARPWLFQILRHRWLHHLRDRSRRIKEAPGGGGIENLGNQPRSDAGGGDPALRISESDALQRALDILDADMKLPLLMVAMDGYTCQEVADLLGLPLGTVLSRIHRAKVHLREYFERSAKALERREVSAP